MPGHLVLPLTTPTSPHELAEELHAAHAFLVRAARATLPRLVALPEAGWAGAAKREHVVLPREGRPPLVASSIEKHSFLEIVNQCATLERMLDALAWIASREELVGAVATTCNPTTSSASRVGPGGRPTGDHDLVLKDARGGAWWFEVSDVTGPKDSNRKEQKDLMSLGVLPIVEGEARAWPDARLFLVVSAELGGRLERRRARAGFHYVKWLGEGSTRIFEVRSGLGPSERA